MFAMSEMTVRNDYESKFLSRASLYRHYSPKVAQAAFVGYVLEITVRRRPANRFSPEGLKGKTSLLANHRMAKPCDYL